METHKILSRLLAAAIVAIVVDPENPSQNLLFENPRNMPWQH